MGFRAHMPLDIADGKPEQVVRVLRDRPGVVMAEMSIMPKSCPRCNGDLSWQRRRRSQPWPIIRVMRCGEVQNGSIREVWQIEHPADR
jgi:hypothetical protein